MDLRRQFLKWGGFVVITIAFGSLFGPMGVGDAFLIGMALAIVWFVIFGSVYDRLTKPKPS